MIIQHQFPLGGVPKHSNSAGLIIFFGVLVLCTAAGFYYNYTLTTKLNKNA